MLIVSYLSPSLSGIRTLTSLKIQYDQDYDVHRDIRHDGTNVLDNDRSVQALDFLGAGNSDRKICVLLTRFFICVKMLQMDRHNWIDSLIELFPSGSRVRLQ